MTTRSTAAEMKLSDRNRHANPSSDSDHSRHALGRRDIIVRREQRSNRR